MKQVLRDFRSTIRESGWRGAIRRYGWRLFAVVFCYYLVRDVTLYIVIPYLIARPFVAAP